MTTEFKPPLNRLRILQINLNKSHKAHLDLINGPLSKGWDIILIQEPYITPFSHIRTPNGFKQISPQDRLLDNSDPTCSVIWAHRKISSNTWKVMNIPGNNNISAIQIHTWDGQLNIFNVYNDCMHSRTLTKLKQFIQEKRHQILPSNRDMLLWGGDFN